ncbi:MAG: hypothetical protein EOP86_13535 [Verrucomicrobiaceae bacterium]|nr:MAG: hypothetical protein EOP86_13535 [Verrucomicrobiaceae bacterium]
MVRAALHQQDFAAADGQRAGAAAQSGGDVLFRDLCVWFVTREFIQIEILSMPGLAGIGKRRRGAGDQKGRRGGKQKKRDGFHVGFLTLRDSAVLSIRNANISALNAGSTFFLKAGNRQREKYFSTWKTGFRLESG